MTITINDLSQFDSAIQQIIDQIDLTIPLSRGAMVVERKAKELCPVNTGELRNSITFEVNGKEAEIGTNLEYAPYVEYGTGLFAAGGNGRQDVPWVYKTADGEWHSTCGQKPQPFLEPAINESRDEIIAAIANSITRGEY